MWLVIINTMLSIVAETAQWYDTTVREMPIGVPGVAVGYGLGRDLGMLIKPKPISI
jgi:hypothetical protein